MNSKIKFKIVAPVTFELTFTQEELEKIQKGNLETIEKVKEEAKDYMDYFIESASIDYVIVDSSEPCFIEPFDVKY